MAKTQIADVVVPRIQRPYITMRTRTLSRFFASGIVRTNEELDAIAAGAGKTFDLPFWNDLSGDSEALSDSGSLTPAKIGADKDVAVKHFRGKSWASNDLAEVLAGDDPLAGVGDAVARYWVRDMQKNILIPSLTGIFGVSGFASTHKLDITLGSAGTPAAGNKISSDAVINAVMLLGDAWNQIVGMTVHSKVFADMSKLGLITFESLKDQDIEVPFFLGREVIVDDGVYTNNPGGGVPIKYATTLFAAGAVGFGDGGPNEDKQYMESDRDKLAGDDILITRRHFILHPRGMAFTGTPAGATPTSAELATAGNWTQKWEDKAIGIVQLLTNAS